MSRAEQTIFFISNEFYTWIWLNQVCLLSDLRRWFCCCWLFFIVTPIVGVCNCSTFCCSLFHVHSSIAIILMGKRELVALLNLSSWCLVMVERLFLAVLWGCLRLVIVVLPDHTHLLFLMNFIVLMLRLIWYTNTCIVLLNMLTV